jgi:CubicO group peptidase (beta-lactamase class C family)
MSDWPTYGWKECTPERQGVDSEKLCAVFDYIGEKHPNIHSLLIVRNGFVVLDAFFYPYEPRVPHDAASVTKSVTSALIGIAIGQGMLKLDQQVLPGVTIRDLVTMTPGLECGFKPGEQELAAMKRSDDWVQFARSLPPKYEPGTHFGYCSPGFHLLSATLSSAAGMSTLAFARKYLFEPLGIEMALWPTDPQGRNTGWGNLHLLPRDFAKIGYLYLHGGEWEGRQLISKDWVRQSITPFIEARPGVGYGFGWWIHDQRDPRVFEANGRGGQRISVIPDRNTIVVLTGGGFEPNDIAPLLFRAMKTGDAVAENSAAYHRLLEKVRAARAAPPPEPVTAALPAAAANVSSKEFRFDDNAMDLKTLTLDFGPQPSVSMLVGRQPVRAPIGLAGSYEIAASGPLNLPAAAKGHWTSENEFLLDLNLIANINHYTMTFTFSGADVRLKIDEATGQVKNVLARGSRT